MKEKNRFLKTVTILIQTLIINQSLKIENFHTRDAIHNVNINNSKYHKNRLQFSFILIKTDHDKFIKKKVLNIKSVFSSSPYTIHHGEISTKSNEDQAIKVN